jgi:ubiquinone/menaquinone biosynthesis C-methylase UbiE
MKKSRQTIREKGLTTIEFLKSPLEFIPQPENSINVIISNCTLNQLIDNLLFQARMCVYNPFAAGKQS